MTSTANLRRLTDFSIESRVAVLARAKSDGQISDDQERERQTLLALRLERDLEGWLSRMDPERAAQLRPHVERALASPDHRQWLDGEAAAGPRVLDAVFNTPLAELPRDYSFAGQCTALTKQTPRRDGTPREPRRCMRGAINDEGLCFQHMRMKYAQQPFSSGQRHE